MTTNLLSQVISILVIVESGNDPSAIGKHGELGVLQERRIFVEQVNIILGAQVYKPEDRLNPVKSRDMAKIWLAHFVTADRLGREPRWQDYAGCFCCGWDGMKKPENAEKVRKYWERCVEKSKEKGMEL
jgi:hypothetical protein